MFTYSVLLLFVIVRSAYSNETMSCCQREVATAYLEAASDMISKAKLNMPSCNDGQNITQRSLDSSTERPLDNITHRPLASTAERPLVNITQRPVDCSNILHMGHNSSGVYTIWFLNRVTGDRALDVYCDMDTDGGGWTLIQRRGDFLRPNDYFYKDWKSYKEGFGNIQEDFWLGNDNIFALTNQKLYSIRFDLEDVESNKAYALYDSFWIDDEDYKYTLHISGYRGNTGDSMDRQNNQKFSTKDQDNDSDTGRHCAQSYKGAWWYNDCHDSNLNGPYLKGKQENVGEGINWKTWKGYSESLKSTEMKIRSRNFLLSTESVVTPLR